MIIDIGGVLVGPKSPGLLDERAQRLGLTRDALLAAVYGGNDDNVLVGRMSEDEWWTVVADRIGELGDLRDALEANQQWDESLVALLRELTGSARTAILSNAWPSQRTRMEALGLATLVDELLLSCEIGVAKPDPEAFRIALARVACDPAETLFIDDTPEHVDVARSLGLVGHFHTNSTETASVIRAFVS